MASPIGSYASGGRTLADGQSADLSLDSTGALRMSSTQGSTAATATYERSVGSDSVATSQPATSVSPAASLLVVAARSGRRSVTVTNITGTQPVFLKGAADITGATTGFYLAAVAGASITIPYSGALYGTSPTAAQTLAVMEVY